MSEFPVVIKKHRHLIVQDAMELYIVDKVTLAKFDYRRKCWICEKGFAIDDGMTVLFIDTAPNKPCHSSCWQRVEKEPIGGDFVDRLNRLIADQKASEREVARLSGMTIEAFDADATAQDLKADG